MFNTQTGEVLLRIETAGGPDSAAVVDRMAGEVERLKREFGELVSKVETSNRAQRDFVVIMDRTVQAEQRAGEATKRRGDEQRRVAQEVADLERRLQSDIDRSTKNSTDFRIAEARREAQAVSDQVERMGLARKEAMALHAKNQDALTAKIEAAKTRETAAISSANAAHARGVMGVFDKYGLLLGRIAMVTTAAAAIAIPAAVGIKQNSIYEDQNLGIAGIVATNERITDGRTGADVTGSAKIIAAQQQVKGVIAQIQKDALLSKATTEELVRGFQAAVGPSMAVGMNLMQVEKYAVSGARAMAALGIPMQQIDQELRSIVDGSIDYNSRLATSLRITNEQVAKERERGTLFDYLIAKFKDLDAAGEMAGGTFSGLLSSLKDVTDLTLRLGTERVFEVMKHDADNLLHSMISLDSNGMVKINDDLREASDLFGEILTDAYNLVRTLSTPITVTIKEAGGLFGEAYKTAKAGLALGVGLPSAVAGAGSGMAWTPENSGKAWGAGWNQVKGDVNPWLNIWRGRAGMEPIFTPPDTPTPLLPPGYNYASIDPKTNEKGALREIERVRDLYASKGTADGYKQALDELNAWAKTHKLGAEAEQKLTAARNTLTRQLEGSIRKEDRATTAASRRGEREDRDDVRRMREAGAQQYSEPAGPIDVRSWSNAGDIGDRFSLAKPWTYSVPTPLGSMGLSESSMNRLGNLNNPEGNSLDNFTANPDNIKVPEATLKIPAELQWNEFTTEVPDGVARQLKKGFELARSVAKGDMNAITSDFGDMVQASIIDAVGKSKGVQDAVASLGEALAGPAGIVGLFGLGLATAVYGVMEQMRKERVEWERHLDGIKTKYTGGGLFGSARLNNDMAGDPKIRDLRESIAGREKILADGGAKGIILPFLKDATDAKTKRELENDRGKLAALEKEYREAFAAGQSQSAISTAYGYEKDSQLLEIDRRGGNKASRDLARLSTQRTQARDEFIVNNWGASAGSMAYGLAAIDKNFELQRKILEEQLKTQKEQLSFMAGEKGKTLGNRLSLLRGEITEDEFNKRERENQIVAEARADIKAMAETMPGVTIKDDQLDTVQEIRDFLTKNPGMDPQLLKNFDTALEIMKLEGKRGSTPNNPIHVRDVDRTQAFALDTGVYMRALSRAAGGPSLSVLNGGAGGTGPVTLNLGGVQIDASSAQTPQETQQAVAAGMRQWAMSGEGQRTIAIIAKNGARRGVGTVNTFG